MTDTRTYVCLCSVDESRVQNVQELATIWGDIRTDVESFGGELLDTYCLLGRYDFLIVFEAPDNDSALQFSVVTERYGLDIETLPATPIDEFGELVQDV